MNKQEIESLITESQKKKIRLEIRGWIDDFIHSEVRDRGHKLAEKWFIDNESLVREMFDEEMKKAIKPAIRNIVEQIRH